VVNQASLRVWIDPKEKAIRDTNLLRVLAFFESWTTDQGWTACQVGKALDLDLLSVRPRLSQAVTEGLLTAEYDDLRYCPYCDKKNQIYRRK
jgi:hypothetical protein